ncbi:XAC2610-related protein [Pedobacter terrae]|uniref:XAC2610-related protein n=1 Tax=Pedobacter terrae TaxID=405671 RepID=UPI002FFB2FE1
MAIQYIIVDREPSNANIYFGKSGKRAHKIFWKENINIRQFQNNIVYEDYNNDGIKDLLIFEDTGARGGNSFYNLYLVNPKNYTLTKVKDFNSIVNPSYNKKYQVILSYGLTGTNYYQLYRLNKKHIPYKIGEHFNETDDLDLDKKIASILKKTIIQSHGSKR